MGRRDGSNVGLRSALMRVKDIGRQAPAGLSLWVPEAIWRGDLPPAPGPHRCPNRY